MSTAAELSKSLKGVNITDLSRSAIVATMPQYVERNRQQMKEGKGKERNIGRYRNPQYAQFKAGLYGEAGLGNVDLRLTGSFQAKMKGEVSGDDIMVTSEDTKAGDLEEKYGGQIYGLNAGTQPGYNESDFLPEFMAQFEKQTGLKAE